MSSEYNPEESTASHDDSEMQEQVEEQENATQPEEINEDSVDMEAVSTYLL